LEINLCELPTSTDAVAGDTLIFVTTGGGDVAVAVGGAVAVAVGGAVIVAVGGAVTVAVGDAVAVTVAVGVKGLREMFSANVEVISVGVGVGVNIGDVAPLLSSEGNGESRGRPRKSILTIPTTMIEMTKIFLEEVTKIFLEEVSSFNKVFPHFTQNFDFSGFSKLQLIHFILSLLDICCLVLYFVYLYLSYL